MCDGPELHTGILLIGSLFWDASRQTWREEHLHMAAAEDVTAPIRYGRRSENRGNTYTMVFSCSAPPGQAKVVPCRGVVPVANPAFLSFGSVSKSEPQRQLARSGAAAAEQRNQSVSNSIEGHVRHGSRHAEQGVSPQTSRGGSEVGMVQHIK